MTRDPQTQEPPGKPSGRTRTVAVPGAVSLGDASCPDLGDECGTVRMQAEAGKLTPHFLLNSLQGLAVLMDSGEHDRARTTVARLARLLRRQLAEREPAEEPLEEHLDFVRDYAGVEGLRHDGGLELEVRVDPEARDAKVPRTLLQPLVENAARHGLAGKKEAGRVEISAGRRGRWLQVLIRDDGRGLPDGWRLERDAGTGLTALRATLCHLYGERHGLSLTDREDARGTEARVTLPYRTPG